jgi:hypothetical protein
MYTVTDLTHFSKMIIYSQQYWPHNLAEVTHGNTELITLPMSLLIIQFSLL